MNLPQTVRDTYNELPAANLPERGARICAIVFDGVPLGDHPVESSGNRFGEKELLAMLLVSCEIDNEIRSIRTLEARPGTPTPDFEATLRSGAIVRIEVTRVADELIAPYMGNMHALFNVVQATRKDDPALEARISGLHVLFEFNDAPRAIVRQRAADEIVRLLYGIQRDAITLCRVIAAAPEFPELQRLGATWTVMAANQPETFVRFRPPLELADNTRMVKAAPTVLESKTRRYAEYSDNSTVPVWLGAFVTDTISGVGLTAIQKLASDVDQLDPGPFQRVMIGNFVAGILIDSTGAVYRSVSGKQTLLRR